MVLLAHLKETLQQLIDHLGEIQLGGPLEDIKSDLMQMRAEQVAALIDFIRILMKDVGVVVKQIPLAAFDFFNFDIKPRAEPIDLAPLIKIFIGVRRATEADLSVLIIEANEKISTGLSGNKIRLKFEKQIPSYAQLSSDLWHCLTRVFDEKSPLNSILVELEKIWNSIEISRIINAVIIDEAVLGDTKIVLTQQLDPARIQAEELLKTLEQANRELNTCIGILSAIANDFSDKATKRFSILDKIVSSEINAADLKIFYDDKLRNANSLDSQQIFKRFELS
jgi:predicted nucleic acid-binding protein